MEVQVREIRMESGNGKGNWQLAKYSSTVYSYSMCSYVRTQVRIRGIFGIDTPDSNLSGMTIGGFTVWVHC